MSTLRRVASSSSSILVMRGAEALARAPPAAAGWLQAEIEGTGLAWWAKEGAWELAPRGPSPDCKASFGWWGTYKSFYCMYVQCVP